LKLEDVSIDGRPKDEETFFSRHRTWFDQALWRIQNKRERRAYGSILVRGRPTVKNVIIAMKTEPEGRPIRGGQIGLALQEKRRSEWADHVP
jgi:hypothetical protein